MEHSASAFRAAEETARNAYGKLLAYLVKRSHDIASAEDALADAFAQALQDWPRRGVPRKPEAWLLTAAKRRLIDAQRRSATRTAYLPTLANAAQMAEAAAWHTTSFPDERLGMFFACAHPAIAREIHAPLMLQAVLGIEAGRIAAAFLLSPAAMRQRLLRAKTKMRLTAIDFDVPDEREIPQRLAAVLDAVYIAYGIAWDGAGANDGSQTLSAESIRLTRMLHELLPDEPETNGLLALLLFHNARSDARYEAAGSYVPLEAQDPQRWSRACIEEAECILRRAGTRGIGRFQLEAAIQSAHAQRAFGREVAPQHIALLYDALIAFTPAFGAAVARCAAHARAFGNEAGLAILQSIDASAIARYQPYWALRAHLTGSGNDYDRAIGLCTDPIIRAHLQTKRNQT